MEEKSFTWITAENKGILGHLDDKGVVVFAVEAGPGQGPKFRVTCMAQGLRFQACAVGAGDAV